MNVDLDLYRKEVRVSSAPVVRLSAIDIWPEQPQHTLVFIHGFGGRAEQWSYQLEHFSQANRTIAFDLRGHGRSDKPRGPYTMQQVVADLEIALNALHAPRKIVVVGHSFGGSVAASFAVTHPEWVEKLVLIASAAEFRLQWYIRLPLSLPLPLLKPVGRFTRSWLGAPPHALQAFYRDTMLPYNGREVLTKLPMPVLVIRGHLDQVLEKGAFEEVSRIIPHAEEVDVGASKHMVMLERRDAVNRNIQRFIEPVPAGGGKSRFSLEEAERAAFLKARPWLPYYAADVPWTLAVPRASLPQFLQASMRRFPERTALRFAGGKMSYRKFEQEINRFANALRWMGVKQGERVLLILPNAPQMAVAFLGTLKAGGAAVLTPPTTPPALLKRQVQETGAQVLVTLAQYAGFFRGLQDEMEAEGGSPLRHVVLVYGTEYLSLKTWVRRLTVERKQTPEIPPEALFHSYAALLSSQGRNAPAGEPEADDLAVIQYTESAAVEFKGVMLSHRNLVANALQVRHWLPGAVEGSECFLSSVPFSHPYGLMSGLILPLALGATLVLQEEFRRAETLEILRKERPTIFPGVPQMFIELKDEPGLRRYGVEALKACLSGAAPLPVEVQEEFEKLSRARLYETYGLAEAGPITHVNPLSEQRKVGSIGIPLPSTEARVVDLRSGRREAQAGQIGELAVRGPQVMQGYWKDAERSQMAVNKDGWLLTGDVVVMDSQGFFRIIARKSELDETARAPGAVSLRDIEEVLYEIPQVKEASVAVVAGQTVAFLIAHPPRPPAEAVIAYCKRRMPPEAAPRLVIFLDEFPRSYIGKVLRGELARWLELSRGEKSAVKDKG
jgi:long-chain acyl-CoA synthetase